MKILILALGLLLSFSTFGSSIIVYPFELEFEMDTNAYELDFELEMVCRYEKFVFGDSSQYHYTYKKIPLGISMTKLGAKNSRVTVANVSRRELQLTGMFKSNKLCQSYLNFFINDKLYALGRTARNDLPIRLGVFEHSSLREFKVFDFSKLEETFAGKRVSFIYKSLGTRIYVRLAFDDAPAVGMSTFLSRSVSIDSETAMPYRLRK